MLRRRAWALGLGLWALAGCGGSCGTDTGPVPGGFPSDLRVERAAQVRLTNTGLDALGGALGDEAARGLAVSCAQASECPTGFVDAAGAPIVPGCAGGVCVEGAARAPYLEVAAPSGVAGGVELCPAACRAHARFGGLALAPRPPAGLTASLDLQVVADLSVRAGEADCVVSVRPSASPGPATVDVDVGTHGPSGATTLGVSSVQLGAVGISVAADPARGDANDPALCAQLTPGPVVQAELEAALAPAVQAVLTEAFGWACAGPADCPSGASCAAGVCAEDATGRTLTDPLAYEARLQLPALLGELGYRGTSGVVDSVVSLGGAVDVDPGGLSLGLRAGADAPEPNPTCATVTTNPVARPGFSPPAGLPPTTAADLDWDGQAETPYDVAFAASQDLLQQLGWAVYTSGLFCGVITQREFSGLTTGQLELIIPSVRFLVKSHLFPRSEAPARLSVYARRPPQLVVGSGEVRVVDGEGEWREPLVRLDLDDVELNVSVLVDERYVRVMTLTLDLHIGVGALVKPNDAIEPVLGVGVPNLVTDVRVTNSELLAENPADLAVAIPTLVSLLVLDLAGSQGEIALPALPGLDLTVLGVRGEDGPSGAKETVAVYANAQPATGGNLLPAAETSLAVQEVRVPETEAFAVTHPGGPVSPEIALELGGEAPAGRTLEYQVRLDGGPWTPFFTKAQYTLRSPALLLQGRHTVEARARVAGAYETLDPSPAEVEVVIDSVAPTLEVDVGREGRVATVDAWDRIGPVVVELVTGDGRSAVEPGEVTLPEAGPLTVEATDAAGNVTRQVLREAPAPAEPEAPVSNGGCTSTPGAPAALWLALGLAAALRRRR